MGRCPTVIHSEEDMSLKISLRFQMKIFDKNIYRNNFSRKFVSQEKIWFANILVKIQILTKNFDD